MAEPNDSSNLLWDPIAELVAQVKSGKTTATSLVQKSLDRIKEMDSEYQALVAVLEQRALDKAKIVDQQIADGKEPGALAGIPFIAKDNFLVTGAETTASSNMLKGFKAPYQSTAVNKLEAEGAICIAKANLDAFAHGSSTENSDIHTTKNPHDKTRVPGGSSGGSAAAAALNMAPFTLGTDTGGSIRQPASFTGVVGYKPTYGLVSRSGVVAMASSTDVIGPLTRRVSDAAYVLDVMSGKDALDSTSIDRDEASYVPADGSLQGKKIGVVREYMSDALDESVRKQTEQAIEAMKQAGADMVEVSIPSVSLALAVYYIVVPAELSSNLARHDGQRYQYSASVGAKDLADSYEMSRSRGFGAEAKRRIMIGTHVLSSGYYDAYYKKAQTVRSKLIAEFNKVFEEVDYLVGPVTPTTAFKIGENAEDPMAMYLQDIMTVAVNLTGMPAISIPNGMIDGLPIGFQIMAPQKRDKDLLQVAHDTERVLG